MFRYMVDIKCFRENGDGTVSVTMGTNDAHNLTIRRRGQEVKFNFEKLYDVFLGAGIADYMPKKYVIEIPTDAVQGNYPNMIRCKFPDDSTYARRDRFAGCLNSVKKRDGIFDETLGPLEILISSPNFKQWPCGDKNRVRRIIYLTRDGKIA